MVSFWLTPPPAADVICERPLIVFVILPCLDLGFAQTLIEPQIPQSRIDPPIQVNSVTLPCNHGVPGGDLIFMTSGCMLTLNLYFLQNTALKLVNFGLHGPIKNQTRCENNPISHFEKPDIWQKRYFKTSVIHNSAYWHPGAAVNIWLDYKIY